MGRVDHEPWATMIMRYETCELRATWEKRKYIYIPGPKTIWVESGSPRICPQPNGIILYYYYCFILIWILVVIIVLRFYDLSFKIFSLFITILVGVSFIV